MHDLKTGAFPICILLWLHIYSNASTVIIEGQNRVLDGWHYNGTRDSNRSQQNINTTLLRNNFTNKEDIPSQGFLNHTMLTTKLLDKDTPHEVTKFRPDFTKKVPRNMSSQFHRTIIRFPKIKRRKFQLHQNNTSLNPISKSLLRTTIRERKKKNNAGAKPPNLAVFPSDVIKLNNKTRNFWKRQNTTWNFPKYVRIKKSDSVSVTYECNIMACPGNTTPSENCLPLCAPKRIAPTQPPPSKLHVPCQTIPPTSSTVPQLPPKLTLPPVQPLLPQIPYKDPYFRMYNSPPPVIISHIRIATPFSPLPIKTPKPSRLIKLSTPKPQRPQTKRPEVVTKLVPPSPSKRVTIPNRFLHKFTPFRPKISISSPPSQIKRRRPYPPDPRFPTETPQRLSPKLPCIDHQVPSNCFPELTTPMPYIPIRYTPLASTIPTERHYHVSPPPDPSLIPELPKRLNFPMPENIFAPPDIREMQIIPPIIPVKPYRLNMWNKLLKPPIPLRSDRPLISKPPPQIHWNPTSEIPYDPVEIHYEELPPMPPILRPPPQIPTKVIVPPQDPIPEDGINIRKTPPPAALYRKPLPNRTIPPINDPHRRMPIKLPFPPIHYLPIQIPNHPYKIQWILPQIVQRPLLHMPPLPHYQIPPPATYPNIPPPFKYPPQVHLLTHISPTPHVPHEMPKRTPPPSVPPCEDKVPNRRCPKVKIPSKEFPKHMVTPPPAPFPQTPAYPELPADPVEDPQIPKRPEATTNTVPVHMIFRTTSAPSHPPPQIKTLSPLPIPCSLKSGIKMCVAHNHSNDNGNGNGNGNGNVYARHVADSGSVSLENITSPWPQVKQNSENSTGQFIPLHNVSVVDLSSTVNLTDNIIEINSKEWLTSKLHKYIDVDKDVKSEHNNMDSTLRMSMPKKVSRHQFLMDHMQSTSKHSEPSLDNLQKDANKIVTPEIIYSIFKS